MSNNGHVWGIDEKEKIWYRKGATSKTILGTTWKSISGKLKQVKKIQIHILRKDKKVKVQKGHYDKERDVSFCEVHLSSTGVPTNGFLMTIMD